MNTPTTDRLKVGAEHQQRVAYVYVRQSSMRQVRNNVESQKLQSGFAEQAAEPGRSRERITVVDEDQGRSGSLPRRGAASPAWQPPSRAASSESS